jgi:2Fe-2S ferredoxin
MPTITIQPSGKTVDAAEGSKLLAAIMASGEKIDHKCEGKAQCGSCHVYIQEGRKGISRIAKEEHEKLDTLVGIGSKSRLACQVVIGTEPVTVELLGFSSGF